MDFSLAVHVLGLEADRRRRKACQKIEMSGGITRFLAETISQQGEGNKGPGQSASWGRSTGECRRRGREGWTEAASRSAVAYGQGQEGQALSAGASERAGLGMVSGYGRGLGGWQRTTADHGYQRGECRSPILSE